MKRTHALRLASLVILGGIFAGTTALTRAEDPPAIERLSLSMGSIFEIIAQESQPGSQYAWVLSLDRTFLQAGRNRSFRTRFSQPGKYQLSAEMQTATGDHQRRTFLIDVREDVPTPPSGSSILGTNPPTIGGVIALVETSKMITLTPRAETLRDATLDLDLSTDEDGDGDPGNDKSIEGTYFATERLPIAIWITQPLPVSIALRASDTQGKTVQQTIAITDASISTTPELPPTLHTDILTEDKGSGVVRFSVGNPLESGVPTLLFWEFGDGGQSMISAPEHRYTASGTYTVRLMATDLRSGTELRDVSTTITVDASIPSTSTTEASPGQSSSSVAPSSPSDETPEEDTPPDTAGPSKLSMLLRKARGALPWILALVGIVAAIGITIFGGVTIFKKLRKGKSLAERLEQADKKMAIGSTTAPSLDVAAEPMQLADSKESTPEESTKKVEETPPMKSDAPMPSWLQKATTSSSTPKTDAPASESPSPAEEPDTADVPEWLKGGGEDAPVIEAQAMENAAPSQSTTPVTAEGPVPAWLQPSPKTVEQKPESPAESIKQQDASATVAPSEQQSRPEENLPSWLQSTNASSVPTEQEKSSTPIATPPATEKKKQPQEEAPQTPDSTPKESDTNLPAWLQPTTPSPETPLQEKPSTPEMPPLSTEEKVDTTVTQSTPEKSLEAPTQQLEALPPIPTPTNDLPAWLTPEQGTDTKQEPVQTAVISATTSQQPSGVPPEKKEESIPAAAAPSTELQPPEDTTTKPTQAPEVSSSTPPSPPQKTVAPTARVSTNKDTSSSLPNPAPALALAPVVAPAPAPAPSIPPLQQSRPILTEKERERRRLKRQRYRQNKLKRAREASTQKSTPSPADAPIAFIRAESISPKPPTTPVPKENTPGDGR